MTKSVTAPLVAVGTAAIKFSSDSQDAFQQFAAATGTASNEMGKYKDMINDVYKDNFGESINDVAEAMATVNQNMSYLDDSALQRCTEYAYTLSDTFGVDVAESTRTADSLIKNYGVSAREAFNLMTQGMQSGLNFSDELFDNIDEYSVQFKKLGLDAEDMFSVFENGAQNGAFNLDKIGDAVKEFSIRAIDGSDTTKQGFEALGMNADEMAQKFGAGGKTAKEAFNEVIEGLASMDDPVAQSAAGVNLFGTTWEDLGPQVITSMSTASDAIDKSRESVEELVNVKYDTLSGALGGLWRTIQVDVLQPIGNYSEDSREICGSGGVGRTCFNGIWKDFYRNKHGDLELWKSRRCNHETDRCFRILGNRKDYDRSIWNCGSGSGSSSNSDL